MRRIAILGCENSHADAFIKCVKTMEEFSDVEVVGVYSDEREAAEKLKEKFGVSVMDDYADAVGKIDGLVITARHGDNHYKYAKPYIDSGIPMFIDKPFTVSESDATELIRAIADKGIRVCGGSSLKHDSIIKQLKEESVSEHKGKTLGGYVRAPYQSENAYGGFYFYSQHLVEMVCEIFGRFPLSVTATQNGGQIHVLFHYGDYDCVGLFCNEKYVYYASRMSESGSSGYEVVFTSDWYYKEFKEFYDLLCGGEQLQTYEEFISPVFIMNAIERSLKSGREEMIPEIKL